MSYCETYRVAVVRTSGAFCKFDFTHFYFLFHDFIYVYSPGAGLTTPWGRNFDVNRNILSLRLFVASFKIFYLKSDFIHFCHDFTHVYSPSLRGQSFDVNRNVLALHSFVASLKKMSLKSDFIPFFFHDLIHVYSPGAGAHSPRGQSFDVNRNFLSLRSSVASFKQ